MTPSVSAARAQARANVRASLTRTRVPQVDVSRLDRLYLAKVADQAERYRGAPPPLSLINNMRINSNAPPPQTSWRRSKAS